MSLRIREAELPDRANILAIYQAASEDRAGIIRRPAEVNLAYVEAFCNSAQSNGLQLVATEGATLLGEIHAYTPSIYAFQHLMTDLTIVVAPSAQGRGIGRLLFQTFLDRIQRDFPHVLRVELFVRSDNKRNLQFYRSLGFVEEGAQKHKIYLEKDQLVTPIHMAWFNPYYASSTS